MARKFSETTEQKAARRAEKAKKMRELADAIEKMTQEQREEIAGGVVTIEGRPLSVHNACMVVSQRPGATVVGGFTQWKQAGRRVRKGEHGMLVWIPSKRKATEPTEADGEAEAKPGFVTGYVFDISQTEQIPDDSPTPDSSTVV